MIIIIISSNILQICLLVKMNITKLFSHRTNFLHKFTVSILKITRFIKVK